ncbi:type IV secretion system protein VirB3 [Massilia scottii]|uniref:type IV secretion system protein VirB3 n=1 Tax=Massilia scottii TaxID=3057166 RepID=UPI0027965912|nr:VirB3 family type IV secretion system protein [Massilia sp. CCM 9029]MDQ1829846.1 VirB3 family type IV secretion system protein [Massilia sp. CCM 9029]
MSGFRDPIFRGCTRPAMFAGVPMLPFLLITGVFLMLTVWTFYLVSGYVSLFLVMAYFPIFVTMRAVTKKDDQRLRQMLMRARMRVRQQAGRQIWGAISFSPIRYKRRK